MTEGAERSIDAAERLFTAAVALEPRERSAYLDAACGGDAPLRAEVESLLRHHRTRTWLDAKIDRVPAAPRLTPGDRVGRFRILRHVADGGMGSVYEAEQEAPRRRVALKVLPARAVGPRAAARIAREAEILARLAHPGIAQVFDAGTFDRGEGAMPYFAMEFIDGRRLTDHATAVGLASAARLALFLEVADAVEHAHQRGVVHRDLKPSNVLVDAAGRPKVLDFGIAQATDADLEPTRTETGFSEIAGTLPYMAPEQLRHESGAVDARTDVHALGIVLYELLTGAVPFALDGASLLTALQVVGAGVPTASIRDRRELRGDLAAILEQATAPEPERRYPTAGALAEDLRRSLRHEPIVARPAGPLRRARRFARRHAIGVTAATVIAVTLIAATVVSSIQAVQARRAEAATASVLDDTRTMLHATLFDVYDALTQVPGSTRARRILVDQLESTIGAMESHAGTDRAMRLDVARFLVRLGVARSHENSGTMLDHAAGRQDIARALAHLEPMAAEFPSDPDVVTLLADALRGSVMADPDFVTLDPRAIHSRILALRRRLVAMRPADPVTQAELAAAEIDCANYHRGYGSLDDAMPLIEAAHARAQAAHDAAPESDRVHEVLTSSVMTLAMAQPIDAAPERREALLREARDLLLERCDRHPGDFDPFRWRFYVDLAITEGAARSGDVTAARGGIEIALREAGAATAQDPASAAAHRLSMMGHTSGFMVERSIADRRTGAARREALERALAHANAALEVALDREERGWLNGNGRLYPDRYRQVVAEVEARLGEEERKARCQSMPDPGQAR